MHAHAPVPGPLQGFSWRCRSSTCISRCTPHRDSGPEGKWSSCRSARTKHFIAHSPAAHLEVQGQEGRGRLQAQRRRAPGFGSPDDRARGPRQLLDCQREGREPASSSRRCATTPGSCRRPLVHAQGPVATSLPGELTPFAVHTEVGYRTPGPRVNLARGSPLTASSRKLATLLRSSPRARPRLRSVPRNWLQFVGSSSRARTKQLGSGSPRSVASTCRGWGKEALTRAMRKGGPPAAAVALVANGADTWPSTCATPTSRRATAAVGENHAPSLRRSWRSSSPRWAAPLWCP